MKINDPILLALIATGFTWFMTALGAAMVFFFKEINKRVLNMMLGFAAGIMVAASFWSLLACHPVAYINMLLRSAPKSPQKSLGLPAAMATLSRHGLRLRVSRKR